MTTTKSCAFTNFLVHACKILVKLSCHRQESSVVFERKVNKRLFSKPISKIGAHIIIIDTSGMMTMVFQRTFPSITSEVPV